MTPEQVQAFIQKIKEVEQKEKVASSASTLIIKAKSAKNAPKGAHVLLYFRKGGMYLTDFINKAFVEMAKWLVENEGKYPAEDKDVQMFVDIRQAKVQNTTEYQVSSSQRCRLSFVENVKPCVGKPGFDFKSGPYP